MNNRNMKIFEMILEQGLLELYQLQQCWEAANRDLRFSQHKDLAKVIVAKRMLSKDQVDKITNVVDNVAVPAEPKEIESTEKFFERMKEISQRIEKIKFMQATQKIQGVSNFKIKPATDKLLNPEMGIGLSGDAQQIESSDLSELKSHVRNVVFEFSKDDEKLGIASNEKSKSSKLLFYAIGVILIISVAAIIYLVANSN